MSLTSIQRTSLRYSASSHHLLHSSCATYSSPLIIHSTHPRPSSIVAVSRRSFASGANNHTSPGSSHQPQPTASVPFPGHLSSLDSPDQASKGSSILNINTQGSSSRFQNHSMAGKSVPSNPADVMVIRDLTPDVATLSVPFARGGKLKFGGRGTLIRISKTGTLAIFSPVALTPAVRAKIDEMAATNPLTGEPIAPEQRVSHIAAPDMEHHIFISEWKAAFPGAKIIGPADLTEKRAQQAASGSSPHVTNDEFAVVFPKAASREEKRAIHVDEAFDADFDYEFVPGHVNQELVFFHRPSRVLVEADLIFNMPPTEQYSRVQSESSRRPGLFERMFNAVATTDPAVAGQDLKWPRRAQWYVFSSGDRASYNDSVARIDQWDFETIVPCHGDTIVGNGKERFRNLFKWHLDAAAAAAKKDHKNGN